MTRTGKIARLPRTVREELNHRLQDGEPGTQLVVWLNALPEVQAALARDFAGRAVSEQNLSEWKGGGYREWLARQEALLHVRELAADARELNGAAGGRLTDHLSTVLAARYAGVLASWSGEATAEFRQKLRALRGLCQDIVELRRGDHSEARLGLERERLEREREKTEEEVVGHFKEWIRNPQVRDLICRKRLSPVEYERQMRELFGLSPRTAGKTAAASAEADSPPGESGQIKPNQT